MADNTAVFEGNVEIPAQALSNPAFLFLYYRIEHILGIKTGVQALAALNKYIEKKCGSSFIEAPAAFEKFLSSDENIYNVSNLLTVNETYFFRESAHFDFLAEYILELAKLNRQIQICSAAVSIGCEAYSIAMVLDYHIKKGLKLDFSIDAFDVNAEAIETAKKARYTANAIRTDGTACKHILDSYLVPDNDEYCVTQNIRGKVNFFTGNIMNSLNRQYDIIFFRNSLIYFSLRSRISVINNLVEALYSGGLLFLGVSETASLKHPLLIERHLSDVFYFQKIHGTPLTGKENLKQNHELNEEHWKDIDLEKAVNQMKNELYISCDEIADIQKTDEEILYAHDVLDEIENGDADSLSGGCIAASILYYLHSGDFDSAEKILTFLEKNNTGAFTNFLRGEYFHLRSDNNEAQKYFQEAAVKNKFFWPAFYRIAVLSADGNRTSYEYKIKKAIESIELSQGAEQNKEHNYECFMDGFSPDYFLRILEKKLIEQ